MNTPATKTITMETASDIKLRLLNAKKWRLADVAKIEKDLLEFRDVPLPPKPKWGHDMETPWSQDEEAPALVVLPPPAPKVEVALAPPPVVPPVKPAPVPEPAEEKPKSKFLHWFKGKPEAAPLSAPEAVQPELRRPVGPLVRSFGGKRVKKGETKTAILSLLQEAGPFGYTPQEIMTKLITSETTTMKYLYQLDKDGVAQCNTANNRWSLLTL